MGEKKIERENMLKEKGFFTVNALIEKLQELKNKGYGDKLVGSDYEHYQYCDYDELAEYVVVC